MIAKGDLLDPSWSERIDASELRFVLLELIGRPGQYDRAASDPHTFYLPLAREGCQVVVTFSNKEITKIERGPAFHPETWARVVEALADPAQSRVGREYSFSTYRVDGSWHGAQSGIQILPPPPNAPVAPVERAEHPFILEFPIPPNESWPITNFRRMRQHRRLSAVLNLLLAGGVTVQPRLQRQLWAIDNNDPTRQIRWVQEFYFAKLGSAVQDQPSPLASSQLKIVDAKEYYDRIGHLSSALEIPADLDESLCRFLRLPRNARKSLDRAAFWMASASRQWTVSASASFASLVIAIEALGDRGTPATRRFRDFLERHAPDPALQWRRSQMYKLRSGILHGSDLMELDQDTQLGWAPPEKHEMDLVHELWGLARLAVRNWLGEQSL